MEVPDDELLRKLIETIWPRDHFDHIYFAVK